MKKITNKIIMIASMMGLVTLIVGIIGIVSFAKTTLVAGDIDIAGKQDLWIGKNTLNAIVDNFNKSKASTNRFKNADISEVIGGTLARPRYKNS